MSVLFEEILIIGGGLIGSSLARAARAKAVVGRLVMSDADPEVRKTLKELGICDKVSESPDPSTADLVMIAIPPARIAACALSLMGQMKAGAILTDVGSIKQAVVEAIAPHVPTGIEFIGGHPIAGTEQSGPKAGFASLFENRWCILTPEATDTPGVARLKAFWQALGSEVAFMSPARHDLVLATTSHLPHLIAYALVGTATDMETVTRNEVVKYSAAGFRDFTRIAASDPVMWRDVFLGNKQAVLEVLGRYIEDLTALKRAIRWDEGDRLLEEFSRTRDIRRRIIDAGQDTATPNFGRDTAQDGPEDAKRTDD